MPPSSSGFFLPLRGAYPPLCLSVTGALGGSKKKESLCKGSQKDETRKLYMLTTYHDARGCWFSRYTRERHAEGRDVPSVHVTGLSPRRDGVNVRLKDSDFRVGGAVASTAVS